MATILLPRQMIVGGGSVAQLPRVVASLGFRKPLILSDAFLKQIGQVDKVSGLLDNANIKHTTCTDTIPDPTSDSVDLVVSRIKADKNDGIIALGGGSPMDTAKAAGVLATHGGKMRDYKAPRSFDNDSMKLIAIPTTAGTGSEATRFTIVTDVESGEKMLCIGLAYLPTAAIVDYEFTMKKPLRLTADTGIDSLTHAIEAYVSAKRNPFADTFALAAMKAISENIRTVCTTPDNRPAREAMMLAATQAGIAFSNSSVCLVHGMSRPLGAFFHIPHGLSNAMLLPAITAFSAGAASKRYAECSRQMGWATNADSDDKAISILLDGLKKLNTDLKVPTLADYGVSRDKFFSVIPTMAQQALASGSPNNNPKVPTQAEIEKLFADIYDGKA
eukprot:comp21381_c0_seq1/m.29413 comp21381_c0_seq1/g.29413  ORF comp21381_c0_seq1/g.29413 comp21381_c0_seq1/m.29413 type:complete len:389 (-) comp21381_c0_seq1:269-1435(-)